MYVFAHLKRVRMSKSLHPKNNAQCLNSPIHNERTRVHGAKGFLPISSHDFQRNHQPLAGFLPIRACCAVQNLPLMRLAFMNLPNSSLLRGAELAAAELFEPFERLEPFEPFESSEPFEPTERFFEGFFESFLTFRALSLPTLLSGEPSSDDFFEEAPLLLSSPTSKSSAPTGRRNTATSPGRRTVKLAT